MYTERDAEIVAWIGGLGAAGAEHVMERFVMGRSWAYARLSRLVLTGLLEQRTLLYRQPGLYVATVQGLRWQGLERLGVYRISPGSFQHAKQLAGVAVALHGRFAGWEVLSERELRARESKTDELFGSVKLAELPGGRPALHRPDLVLVAPELEGRVVGVELELSVKAPRRLAAICRGWARARHIDHVYYLAVPAAARALERAIADTRAEHQITVLDVSDVDGVLRCEQGRCGNVPA
ncbi:MAG TPA: hypothetical protein VMB51_09515 [Solirubrobacteraceae bacterium]|nr:hypothetical protein [Solirubrobacteraceae bacterium]